MLMAASVLIAYVCARLVRHVWKIARAKEREEEALSADVRPATTARKLSPRS